LASQSELIFEPSTHTSVYLIVSSHTSVYSMASPYFLSIFFFITSFVIFRAFSTSLVDFLIFCINLFTCETLSINLSSSLWIFGYLFIFTKNKDFPMLECCLLLWANSVIRSYSASHFINSWCTIRDIILFPD